MKWMDLVGKDAYKTKQGLKGELFFRLEQELKLKDENTDTWTHWAIVEVSQSCFVDDGDIFGDGSNYTATAYEQNKIPLEVLEEKRWNFEEDCTEKTKVLMYIQKPFEIDFMRTGIEMRAELTCFTAQNGISYITLKKPNQLSPWEGYIPESRKTVQYNQEILDRCISSMPIVRTEFVLK